VARPLSTSEFASDSYGIIIEKSGLVDPSASYYVKLENVTNLDNQDLKTMVDRGRYFSIFAPRQSGKTTFSKAFAADWKKTHCT
jgi:hypothetical protein